MGLQTGATNRLVKPAGEIPSHYLEENYILDLLPAAVFICDMSGVIRKYNEQAAKLWGRRPVPGNPDERFSGAFRLYRPDGACMPHDESPVAASLKDGLPRKDVEVIIERPDLSRCMVSMNIVPMADGEGKQVGVMNCFHDISDQKQTEKDLQRKTVELQDYVNNASIGLHWVNAAGIIVWANKAELDMLGYTAEEYIGRHIAEFHVHKEKIDDILTRLNCNETLQQYESELRCKDGSIKTVRISSNVFREDGQFIHTRCFTIDVTNIKSAENALREGEAKYRQLALSLKRTVEEKIQDLQNKTEELRKSEERYHKMIEEVEEYAIILLDKNGIVQHWNRGAEKIKGYKEEEIVGKSFEEFYLQEDRDMGVPAAFLEKARREGKSSLEGWRRKKDGTSFWGNTVLTALHDAENNIIGFSKVTRDLTDKKMAEDQMREYMNQLEFQNKELEQFVYAASHDMKEPLRKIWLYNDFIAGNAANQLDNKSKDYLKRSIHAVQRMNSLIEDLLTYSRTTSYVESYEEVDLNNVMEEIIQLHREEFEQAGASIDMTPLPRIRAIPFQIQQLLFNLVNNAVKYRHPNRDAVIKITSEVVNAHEIPELKAEGARQYYRLAVSDNGIGFDPRYAGKIFEIFQRLNNLPAAKGSGIGLAICKKIVQNHKGSIQAIGIPNEGASFVIYLPKK
ncbi:MAG TPA: PAS domain S-box protein [Chitinophaga sp.]|uniref:PAS domain-containing sensor histidine kinase n=1 Tax=Chitinophaga sp. TaxID=1869181 RepID=UPI002DBA9136|nr:PAS domain S-box protein [Chitinophaga sp.]HEU4551263.1 PAS domain S-box protein [Chitinophaga sp.]